MSELPVIDMSALFNSSEVDAHAGIARRIRAACRSSGFFYVTGHGVPAACLAGLETQSRIFFALPVEQKMRVAMCHGGLAWRGYFPLDAELTSAQPDHKEGLYFGTELAADHPRVRSNTPLHGANLWPRSPPALRHRVLEYMHTATLAAQTLLKGVALSLDLPPTYFADHYTANPTVLFRIFHYPASAAPGWGVGEHTDYGLLTLLAQDRCGGLQVKSAGKWIAAPPLEGALVCNIGDMLDRLTGGYYRSTPHRVKNTSGQDRLSFPLFFDPDFAATMQALPKGMISLDGSPARARWDDADLQAFEGTYGDYLLAKVARVFPELATRLDAH